jgi:hypothetical protein
MDLLFHPVEVVDSVRPADAADASVVCLPTDASVRSLNVGVVVVRFVKGVVKGFYRYLFPVMD